MKTAGLIVFVALSLFVSTVPFVAGK